MGLPAGYQLRAPTPDDLGPVAEALIADDLDDAGQVVLDEGFLLRRRPRRQQPEQEGLGQGGREVVARRMPQPKELKHPGVSP